MALSVHRFSDSLQTWQKVRSLYSPRVSQDMGNRGESIQPAPHGFSRRHDNSWDLRGGRANLAFARSVRCAKAIGAPERHRSRRAGRPLHHRRRGDRCGRKTGFGPDTFEFHSSRQRPTCNHSHFPGLSGGDRTSARSDLRPRRHQSFAPAAHANRKRDCSFPARNNGRLDSPCFVYRLTRGGLFSSLRPTRDGNLLAKEVEKHKSPRMVWRTGRNGGPNLLRAWVGSARSPTHSLRAPWARLPSIRGRSQAAKSWYGSVRAGL